MICSVRFLTEAAAEASDALRWYESRRSGLGTEFVEAVDHTVSRIAKNPVAFPKVRGEVRRAVLSRFPYAVYFRLVGDAVVVLAVLGRQHPERWQSRA
ncbi:MAG: type II toxin-antitoxin system RelE/ParE family toxin [Acidobacteria bacterium]|nr:type II toxin-antitoxin system RelE/ParE family toxin [Acidobacteriota bacterium]